MTFIMRRLKSKKFLLFTALVTSIGSCIIWATYRGIIQDGAGSTVNVKSYSTAETIQSAQQENTNGTTESYCQNDSLSGSDRYLVIGGMSYPGYLVSSLLKSTTRNIQYRITEDVSSIGFDPGTWRNWDKLKEIDSSPSIDDYGSDVVVASHLKWLQSRGTVVYIPSLLFNAIHKSSFFDVKFVMTILNNFIKLLEALRKCEKSKVIFFTPEAGKSLYSSPHATAIRQFSLVLSSYGQYHNMNIKVISFSTTENCNAPHNFYCCDRIDFYRVLNPLFEGTLHHAQSSESHFRCSYTQGLLNFSSDLGHTDVVTSSYFTKTGGLKKNNFQLMKGFFMTAIKHDMKIVLFHDEMSSGFQNDLKSYHNDIDFVKIDGLNGRKTNDARFYFLYDYLLNHPEVRSLLLQDLRDGIFQMNPFRVMNAIGDNVLYVGSDLVFWPISYDFYMTSRKYKNCYHQLIEDDEVQYWHGYTNAGTIGGTRDVMLTFLTRLIKLFDVSPHNQNCNMATVLVVVHYHFFEHFFMGYPFASYGNAIDTSTPRGIAVRHKGTDFY